MERKHKAMINGAAFIFMVVFGLSAVIALMDFGRYQEKMSIQVFGPTASVMLSYIVPLTFVATIILLFIPETRTRGLLASAILMLAFTGYTGMVFLGMFQNQPCTCISITEDMSWSLQFQINLVLSAIALFGVFISGRKEVTKIKTKKEIAHSPMQTGSTAPGGEQSNDRSATKNNYNFYN